MSNQPFRVQKRALKQVKQKSPALNVIDDLHKERLRAFQPNYIPTGRQIDKWVNLRNMDPSSISHNGAKKRACHYLKYIFQHSENLFTLCALSISWSRLGVIKDEEYISEICTWWDRVERSAKLPNLRGISVNCVGNFETHRRDRPPESSEPLLPFRVGHSPTLENRAQEYTLRNGVQPLLDGLDGFDEFTKSLLQSIPLSTFDDISEEAKTLWEQAHTTYPRLFQSKQCWGDQPPTDAALFLATTDMIAESKSNSKVSYATFCRGELDTEVDPSLALAQLWSPNPAMPVSLIGVKLPKVLPESIFKCPEEMSLFVEPFEQSNQHLFVTPTYCKTDLHIDTSEGLSLPLGSEKLCLLFPGTKHNLDILQTAEGQKEKLARVGKSLEGGLVTNLTSSHAIYIPLGCIHSVLTKKGGFLITIDFIAPTSAKAYSALFCAGLDRIDGRRDQKTYFDKFLLSVELALHNNRESIGIDSWVKSLDRIQEWAGGHPAWSRKATKMWCKFLKTLESKNLICPCGESDPSQSFQEHFKCHL